MSQLKVDTITDEAGTGAPNFPFGANGAGVPAGVIVMWSGSIANIPAGFFLCDGANGTPDLRDRFVVGAGSTYAVGATGGADSVTLTAAQIPDHTHTFSGSTNTVGDHTHTFVNYQNGGPESTITPGSFATRPFNRPNTSAGGAHGHSFSGTTASTGGGDSHENRPPYFALAYIMKV